PRKTLPAHQRAADCPSESRVVFRKTGCNVGAVVTRAYRSASCYSDGSERLRARELGDGLGALGDGVLGELAREHEADGRLDFAGRERRLLGEAAQLGGLEGDALEDVVDERVHDRHALLGDARVRVHLLEHAVDVRRVRLRARLLLLGAAGLLGGFRRLLGGGLGHFVVGVVSFPMCWS
ncbi:unnamed protein product, partial [Pelagomonas calceolata]